MKLTNSSVKSLAVTGAQVDHFDDALPGFGVRVNPGGSKTYFIMIRQHGRTRRHSIGRSNVVSADVARAKAKEMMGRVAMGEDLSPASSLTLREALEWDYDTTLTNRSASYRNMVRTLITHHVPARLMKMKVQHIKRADLLDIVYGMPQALGGWTFRYFHAFLTRLVNRGFVEFNPLAGIKNPHKRVESDRVHSPDELLAIRKYAEVDDQMGLSLLFLITTLCRRNEGIGLKKSEVNLQLGEVHLPAERIKTNKPHTIILPKRLKAKMQLWDQPSGLLFFGSVDAQKLIRKVRKYTGISDFTLHNLRRSGATHMAALGVAPHVIELALNHSSTAHAGVAGVYNRYSYRAEVEEALQAYENWVQALGRPMRLLTA